MHAPQSVPVSIGQSPTQEAVAASARLMIDVLSNSAAASRAWISTFSGTPCAWEEDKADADNPHATVSGNLVRASTPSILPRPPSAFHFGGIPGDKDYECLAAEELESRLRFCLSTTLIAQSPNDQRRIPLELLPPECITLPSSNEIDWKSVKEAIRAGWSHPDVFIAADEFGGHCLYAATKLPAYCFISEYTGVLLWDANVAQSGKLIVDDYALSFPSASGMTLSALEHGSIARFSNHAAQDQATCTMACVVCDGCAHQCLFTKQDILPRTALTWDYGAGYWEARGREPGVRNPSAEKGESADSDQRVA